MTRPRLRLGPQLIPGLVLAVALFTVFVLTVLSATFEPTPDSLPGGSVTDAIGFALLDLDVEDGPSSEGFLAALILIALVLDAALDGAVHLASRERDGSIVSAIGSQGGDEE